MTSFRSKTLKYVRAWRHCHMTKLCLWADRHKHFSQSEYDLYPNLYYYKLNTNNQNQE